MNAGLLLRQAVQDSIQQHAREAVLVGSLQSIEQQISSMIDGAEFSEITTKEFDAIKRCHYIVLKELRQLGLLAF